MRETGYLAIYREKVILKVAVFILERIINCYFMAFIFSKKH